MWRTWVTTPLSHLINAFHSPKNISFSVNTSVSLKQHRDIVPEHEAPSSEVIVKPNLNYMRKPFGMVNFNHIFGQIFSFKHLYQCLLLSAYLCN